MAGVSGTVLVAHDDLRRLLVDLFAALGLPGADAAIVADGLLFADLRGMASHGVSRLPVYAERLRTGACNPRPSLAVESATPAVGRIDGDGGMGFVVATSAMADAIERARTFGVGLTLARRSGHFGMSAIYLYQANAAGMAALVLSNASATMPVWGGRAPFLGTSPFAMSAPAGAEPPLVLDMATSTVAKGKIRRALIRGETIPDDWALDADGRRTTDPAAAIDGIMLPLGGPKGSGLSLLMEAFAGVMAGAAFGGDTPSLYKDMTTPQNTGHLFMALRPDLFVGREAYEAGMDTLVARAKASPLAEGFDEILMPGERGARTAAERRANGIPLPQVDLDMLAAEAAKAGVRPL